MAKVRIAAVFATVMAVVLAVGQYQPVAAGPVESSGYKALKPIESGDLTLFPVVRASGKMPPADQFLTLDEGLKNGEVEVTEAGRVRGLVRPRGGAPRSAGRVYTDAPDGRTVPAPGLPRRRGRHT